MADFSKEIAALQAAIASGATRVSYDGRSVDYDSFANLLARLRYLQSLTTGATQVSIVTSFDRDDY